MRAIDTWFDYQDRLKNTLPSPNPISINAAEEPHSPTSTSRPPPAELPADKIRPCNTTGPVRQQGSTAEAPRATRTRFAWHKGFLTAHKPPTRRMTPTAMPKCRSAPATNLANKIRHVAAETSTHGTQRTFLRKDQFEDATNHFAQPIAPPLDPRQMESCTTFMQRYNVRVCLYGKKGEVYSEWEGITIFFQKLQEFDETIQVLPWHVQDHNDHNPPLAISSIPNSFFNLQTYVPRLASTEASWTTRIELGRTCHPFLFLSSSISPEELANKMGPWLRDTKQGLWPRQLPLTEQTKCLGWFLYLAPEYHLSALRQQIKQATGIDVALRFRTISDGRPVHADHTRPRTKAIHIEVDEKILPKEQQRVESLYASTARTFPLGIKMRLIPELGTTVPSTTSGQVIQMTNRQARFLAYTKTSRLPQAVPEAVFQRLRDMTLPSGPANHSAKPLFHAISPMANKEGYLVRYLPQYSTQARAVLAQFVKQPSKEPKDSAIPVLTSLTQTPQLITATPTECSHLVELDTWMGSRFCMPLGLDSIAEVQPVSACSLCLLCSTTNQPSNHNILRWLTSLRQLFLNTTWDRWQYQNGIAHPWQESPHHWHH